MQLLSPRVGELRVQEEVDLVGGDPGHRFLRGDQSLVHQIDGDAHGRLGGGLVVGVVDEDLGIAFAKTQMQALLIAFAVIMVMVMSAVVPVIVIALGAGRPPTSAALPLAARGVLLFQSLKSSEHLFLGGLWQSSISHWVEDQVFLLDVLAEQSRELPHGVCEHTAVFVAPARGLLREPV